MTSSSGGSNRLYYIEISILKIYKTQLKQNLESGVSGVQGRQGVCMTGVLVEGLQISLRSFRCLLMTEVIGLFLFM